MADKEDSTPKPTADVGFLGTFSVVFVAVGAFAIDLLTVPEDRLARGKRRRRS